MRRFGVACLVAGFVLATAAGALAVSADWSHQPTPNPAGAKSSYLNGVSCALVCMAVGAVEHRGGRTLAVTERWNKKKWELRRAADPHGAKSTDLTGVSCIGAHACTAVGYYTAGAGARHALAERWTGKHWSLQKGPSIKGEAILHSVSCTSPLACTAVGASTSGRHTRTVTVAEHWDGKSWRVQHPRNHHGASQNYLVGIWCTWKTACTAVGYFKGHGGIAHPLAERWTGKKWHMTTPSAPSGATAGYLLSVSCPFSTNCVAVGYFKSRAGGKDMPFAERWTGRKWTLQRPPDPGVASNTYLDGVSCVSADACTAVGYFASAGGNAVTVAERWNGKRWSPQRPPSPGGSHNSYLYGVSCPSPSACTAAGAYDDSAGTAVTLADRWHSRK